MASMSVPASKRGIACARGEEIRVALQVHLVGRHAGTICRGTGRRLAQRSGVAGRAVQADERHAILDVRRPDRRALWRAVLEDEPKPLVALARPVRAACRRRPPAAPARSDTAGRRVSSVPDRSVLEVREDVVLRGKRYRGERARRRRAQARPRHSAARPARAPTAGGHGRPSHRNGAGLKTDMIWRIISPRDSNRVSS